MGKNFRKFLKFEAIRLVLDDKQQSNVKRIEYLKYLADAKDYECCFFAQLYRSKVYAFINNLIKDEADLLYDECNWEFSKGRTQLLQRMMHGEWKKYAAKHFKATMIIINHIRLLQREQDKVGFAKRFKVSSNYVKEILKQYEVLMHDIRRQLSKEE